jgi:hypothetical protein
MRIRVILTIVAILMYMAVGRIYSLVESPSVGAANAQQMTDTTTGYAIHKAMSQDAVRSTFYYCFIGSLVVIWGSLLLKRKKLTPIAVATASIMFLATGCMKPVKVLDPVDIKPNETAWAIPLDGSSRDGQVKFNSVDFLNAKKVSAKRYMIDKVERKIGRFDYEIEWIPATRIVKVDRSLVTRKWAGKDQDIGVGTRDSVQLRVGLTITASIDEDDASTYLYYHGEKPLADVIDQNIRSFAEAELTKEYNARALEDAQKESATIYAKLFDDAKVAFKAKGITIQYLGNAEGLSYADPTVQAGINKSYLAQQDRQTAQQEQEAAKIRNQTAILTAQATAEAAAKTFSAKEASELQTELKIRQMEAEAKLAMAQKWDGKLPDSILPSDSPLLMSLGAKRGQTIPAGK